MQKTYVLDANVLIQAPYALESFEDNHIVLPLAVLEELDGLKGADGEAGGNARQVLRFLEGLRLQGSLVEGVSLPGGGTLRLEINHVEIPLPPGLDPASRAGRVLKVCRGLMGDGTPVILVTRDMVARIRAQMMGVPAEDFTTDRLPEEAPLVIVQGPAGTAKTFYALAAGLEQVLEREERLYRKILVCRPNAQFDQDIGFLPGSERDKISPLMRPVADNLEILLDLEGKKEKRSEEELRGRIDYLFDTGVITAEAMNFMRGRSITDTWLIIDEAQNLTPPPDEGHRHPGGPGDQGDPAGGPGTDRPPPAGRQEQRPDLCQPAHAGQPPVHPAHHAP